MKKERAVIFDLDGTITDTESVWIQSAKVLLERRDAEYDPKLKLQMMGKSLRDGTGILKEKYGLKEDLGALTRERHEVATKLFSENIPTVPGALDFVRATATKYKIAIATSMDRASLRLIDKVLQLSDLFADHIYSIEDVGFISKPDPAIFLFAAKELEIAPERSIVIEDSPNGVLGAKRAGMKCVALTTSTDRVELSLADRIVDSFSEIKLDELYE